MPDPGFLTISADEYHADPAPRPSLTASTAHTLCTESPKHAWTRHPKLNPDFERDEDPKFDVGRAAHSLLIEGVAGVEIVDAPDWRTKVAQEARDQARANGLTPMLLHQWQEVDAMVAAAGNQLADHNADPQPFTNGKPEQTAIWQEGNLWCRARLDWIHNEAAVIDDYKTTRGSADPASWTRTMFSIGADIQAVFYQRAMLQLTGGHHDFRFIVQETSPPYALSVVMLSPQAQTIAEKKMHFALALWEDCLKRDLWPAYPLEVAYADLPPWEEERWLQKEMREALV